jgi:probable rRNA maturation factor
MITVLLDDGGYADVPSAALEQAVHAAFAALGVEEGEVSLALLGDDTVSALHREHLGHDGPTDVLSFALYEAGEPVLGDVYVGIEQAARQAAEAGVTLQEELIRLVVHGTLHVLGLDHPTDASEREASPMYRTQEALVRMLLEKPSP